MKYKPITNGEWLRGTPFKNLWTENCCVLFAVNVYVGYITHVTVWASKQLGNFFFLQKTNIISLFQCKISLNFFCFHYIFYLNWFVTTTGNTRSLPSKVFLILTFKEKKYFVKLLSSWWGSLCDGEIKEFFLSRRILAPMSC